MFETEMFGGKQKCLEENSNVWGKQKCLEKSEIFGGNINVLGKQKCLKETEPTVIPIPKFLNDRT
jgi:hypothetical protein